MAQDDTANDGTTDKEYALAAYQKALFSYFSIPANIFYANIALSYTTGLNFAQQAIDAYNQSMRV